MPKSSYISFNDDSFAAQLQTFKNAIGAYDVALGIPKPQVTAQGGRRRLLQLRARLPAIDAQRQTAMDELESARSQR